MKNQHRLLNSLLFIFVLSLCSSLSAFGAPTTPQATVHEIVSRLQTTQDPVVVTEYVHWETAYKKAPEPFLASQNIHSPEELKRYYQKALGNTSGFLNEMARSRMASLSEDKKAVFQEKLDKVAAAVTRSLDQVKEQISRTNYTVGKSTIEGDTARVELASELDGAVRNDEVRLIRVGDRWFLASMQIVK